MPWQLEEWQRKRIAELEIENAGLRADIEAMKKWALDSDATNDALRADNVGWQRMFARMRSEWIKQMSKSLWK